MTHVRPASTGEMVSSKSLPYRHMPASSRRLSLAPSPMSWTSGNDAIFWVTATASFGGMEI